MATDCPRCNNKRLIIDPTDQLCNNCGDTLCPLGTMNYQVPHGLYNCTVRGGYDSYHLFDCTKYTFSLCEKCLRHMFMAFIIKPQINDEDIEGNEGIEEIWEKDQKYYEYRLWTDSGGDIEAYKNGKCNFVKDCPNDAVYSEYLYDEFSENCCCEEHKNLKNYSGSQLKPFVSNTLKPFL